VDEFQLAGDGQQSGDGDWLYQRVRLNPRLDFGRDEKVRLVSQADLVDGYLLGPGPDVLDSAALRKLYFEWDSPAGRLSIGQQTSHWGLGILANDGESDGHFSDGRGGDMVERVMFATTPLAVFSDSNLAQHLFIAVGADMVFLDENADWMAGDEAWQAVGALFYRSDTVFVGFYSARRSQTDRDTSVSSAEPDGAAAVTIDAPGATLDVWALDLFAGVSGKGSGLEYSLAAEAAWVVGETTRGTHENNPDRLDVNQIGAAVEAEIEVPKVRLRTSVQGGFAQGDRNTLDGTATGFKFDPGYRVGMILFDDVLSGVTAHSAERLSDPEQKAVPPGGARFVPTNAAVANALYVAPVVGYAPVRRLEITLGGLFAVTPAGLIDPYATQSIYGGAPANPWGIGADEWAQLGFEADAGVRWDLPTGPGLDIGLAAQAGLFIPGAAFERADGTSMEAIAKARVGLEVGW